MIPNVFQKKIFFFFLVLYSISHRLVFVQTISYGLKSKIESFGIAILCHGRPCMREKKAKKAATGKLAKL